MSPAAPCPCAVCTELCGSLERHCHSIFRTCRLPHCPMTPAAIHSNCSPSCDLLYAVLRSQLSSVIRRPLRVDFGSVLSGLCVCVIVCGDLLGALGDSHRSLERQVQLLLPLLVVPRVEWKIRQFYQAELETSSPQRSPRDVIFARLLCLPAPCSLFRFLKV